MANRETVDDTHPLARGGSRDWVATARQVRKALTIIVPAVIVAASSLVGAYRTLRVAATAQAQAVKDLSESGYRVAAPVVDGHERRIWALEESVRRLRIELAEARPPKKGAKPARRPPSPPAPAPLLPAMPAPKPLPANLDEAYKQVYKAAGPPAVPVASPPDGAVRAP